MRRCRGFSLTELVATLVILGALAVFAAPRLNIGGFDALAFREAALAAVRYARSTAAASGCPVEVAIEPGNDRIRLEYAACDPFGTQSYGAAAVTDPTSGGAYVVQGPTGALTAPATTLTFDGYGTPDAGVTIAISGADDIAIETRTGYIR